MKRLTIWFASTATAVVLLFSYHTSTSGPGGGKVVAGVAPVGVVPEATAPVPSPDVPASSAPSAAPTAAAATRRINGVAVDTRYGPVQVQITMRGSRIVAAQAIAFPQGEQRDLEINGQAIPLLNDETLQAQSAQIDAISGATYTSDGYRGSLQSAIDAAHR